MFLSTASMMFLSTAYLCLKGPTGLPSLLPTRECLDMVKQKNRRARLLCKGLEHFREALYSEPMVDAASKKDQSAPSAAVLVAEATTDKESSVSAKITAEQGTRSSVKKPCTFFTADGGELFKTLLPVKKTPPTSPGSVASSSTAVEPSSRKVSPSGSDIKDFAYPSSDEHHVLDPTTIIEETTKKQLLKQLKKTAAIEEEQSRKVVKLAAENEALNAELTSANATVRNRDAQTDLAKTYANAMNLSNIVLRQTVLDVGHQVRSGHNDNPKGEALQKHLRIMDAVSVSAHSDMARLENHSAGQGRLNSVQNSRDTTEDIQPKSRVEESEVSKAPEIQLPNTVANLEDAISANRTVLNNHRTHKQQRIKSEGHPAEETMEQVEESASGEGQVFLHTTATSCEDSVPGNLASSKSSGDDQVFSANRGSSPSSEVEKLVAESDGDDAAHQSPTGDALTFHNDAQVTNSIADCGVSATYEFLEPAGPATMWGILQSDETVGAMGPEGDRDDNLNDVQGVNGTDEGNTDTKYEYIEPAGPATLWGILQSNQTSGECDTEGDQGQTSATQEPIPGGVHDQDMDCDRGEDVSATYEFSEPAGPATMWGILQSDQTTEETGPEGDHTKDAAAQDPITGGTDVIGFAHTVENSCEGGVNQNYEFPEPSGAATLWGILHSNQGEFSESTGPATLCETLQSSQCEEVEDNSALILGEPGLASGSNESPTDQESGHQEPETRESEVEELTTDPVKEEDHTQSIADAGEEAIPEAGGSAPQAIQFYFDWSEVDVIAAQGSLDEPQGVSTNETSTSHEAASPLVETTHNDSGNDEKSSEQSTEIGVVLDIQSESNQSTIVQGQSDAGFIDLSLDNYQSAPLDVDSGVRKFNCSEEEIAAPATSPDTSGSGLRYRDEIGGEILQTSELSSISTQPARTLSLPEPEVFDFPGITPKPSSKSEAEIKAEKKAEKKKAEKKKAEKKKAEHRRYKAKKKAEAAAKRRLKEEEEKEVAEEVEALEPPITLAQIQAEEDRRLGVRRLEQQAKRQEQQDKAASLRGLVRSSRAHLIY